jgi:hypothetical protein
MGREPEASQISRLCGAYFPPLGRSETVQASEIPEYRRLNHNEPWQAVAAKANCRNG